MDILIKTFVFPVSIHINSRIDKSVVSCMAV